MLAEEEEEADDGVSQSVPSDQVTSQSAAAVQDVILIETDSDSLESKEREEAQQDDEDEEEDEEEEEEDEVQLCLSFSRLLLFGLNITTH